MFQKGSKITKQQIKIKIMIDLRKSIKNEFILLKNIVTSFDGDPIAICFQDKMVKKVCECGDNTTMFQTEDGILISVSNNKLK